MKQYIKREFLTPEEKKLIVKVKLPIARLDRVRAISKVTYCPFR